MTNEYSDQAVISSLISRFLKNGLESFSIEDLALCLTIP